MRGMQKFYAQKGWTSAPHIYTAPDGIWLATPMSRVGIHAGRGNGSVAQGWYSIGLEMVGYYDKKLPSGKIWEYSLAVMGELSKRLQIAPRQLISFHRDYTNQKSCPGWAVTKEWVWSAVEAYVNNAATPAPPPPGAIGTPTPSDELLLENLLNESYGQRAGSQGYNPDWAFHDYAVEHSLGMPLGQSKRFKLGGKEYNYQPFARDTLYCEVPNWGDVRTLSDLLNGSIPPSGLGRALLDATYQAGGSDFRPDWAFHQYAVLNRLGSPVGKSVTITVDGKKYAYQAFAVDTLYNLVPNWSDVQQLSRLAAATDAANVKLREALLAETYKQAGVTYHADWAFHQQALKLNIGTPLSKSYQIKLEQTAYALQVYALDTLYNIVPKWSDVRRMNDLAVRQGMPVLGASFGAPAAAPAEVAVGEPPTTADFAISRYTPQASAWSERAGHSIDLVVLHGVPGAAEAQLAQMAEIGAGFSTHYYVGLDGAIVQLVDEDRAAWHAGFATGSGVWYNLNRNSIGIALERPSGWPLVPAEQTDAQLLSLRWLLEQLNRRYRLTTDSLMLWSSFAAGDGVDLDGLPIAALREALMG
jgi:hypothetical protein